jgi:hypothetical protein
MRLPLSRAELALGLGVAIGNHDRMRARGRLV